MILHKYQILVFEKSITCTITVGYEENVPFIDEFSFDHEDIEEVVNAWCHDKVIDVESILTQRGYAPTTLHTEDVYADSGHRKWKKAPDGRFFCHTSVNGVETILWVEPEEVQVC